MCDDSSQSALARTGLTRQPQNFSALQGKADVMQCGDGPVATPGQAAAGVEAVRQPPKVQQDRLLPGFR
jgi:hypothetical protein